MDERRSELGRGVGFTLTIAPAEALERISAAVDRASGAPTPPGYGGTRPFLGWDRGAGARIRRRHSFRNSLAPLLYGEVRADGDGSRIIGEFRLHPVMRWTVIIWGALLSILSVAVGIASAWRDSLERSEPPSLLIPVFALGCFLVIVGLGRVLGGGERALRRFVDDLFADVRADAGSTTDSL